MVEIRTRNNSLFGQETITASGKVKFDIKGFAKVEDKIARELIKKFTFITLAEGSELPDEEKNVIDSSKVEKLIRENNQLKDAVNQLTKEKVELLQENRLLINDITDLQERNKKVEIDIDKVEAENVNEDIEINDLIAVIYKTPKTELLEIIKSDEVRYPEFEWKDLNVKELRIYMAGKLKEESKK